MRLSERIITGECIYGDRQCSKGTRISVGIHSALSAAGWSR